MALDTKVSGVLAFTEPSGRLCQSFVIEYYVRLEPAKYQATY